MEKITIDILWEKLSDNDLQTTVPAEILLNLFKTEEWRIVREFLLRFITFFKDEISIINKIDHSSTVSVLLRKKNKSSDIFPADGQKHCYFVERLYNFEIHVLY